MIVRPTPSSRRSTECRASAGSCDLAENCTGSSAACPADAKSTAVCRGSAGVCDVAESCDGVNDDCPADAFEPASTVCRASAGQCDVAENCTGTGPLCPSDAKSTALCRASAGVCDVAESCDGVNDDCPADAFEPASTECRASGGVCDDAENCTGSSAACPADAFEPASTVCRPAASDCDVAENCTGSSASCPADTLEPDGTSCNDGQTCTIQDQCESGTCVGDPNTCGDGIIQAGCFEECDDGNQVSGDGCSNACQTEFLCEPTPEVGCRPPVAAGKAQLQIKNKTPDSKDQIQWKYKKGAATTKADFGDPPGGTDYAFCIYANGTLISSAAFPGASFCNTAPCWREQSTGYRWTDRTANAGGLTKGIFKAGAAGKTTIQLKLQGVNIDMPSMPVAQPIVVQLKNSDGVCWETTMTAPAIKNTPDQFKDKND